MSPLPEVSVVVPLLNEEDNVLLLVDRVRDALGETPTWELILVDDGSQDRTVQLATECAESDSRIRVVSLARRYGQSTAMQAGFDRARGDVIVTMDGDLQNDPQDIPLLLEELSRGSDLVAGYRENRKDVLISRKIPSWIANRIITLITGVSIRDNGCSLKAYRAELLERMRLYSDLHRFIPALAAGIAGARITEVPVRHHPRVHGESKYGLSRVGPVLVDLIAVKMIRSYRMRPLRMFGGAAVISGLLGALFATAVMTANLTSIVFSGVSLLWLALALFLLMLGLVGQVAVGERNRQGRGDSPLLHEKCP